MAFRSSEAEVLEILDTTLGSSAITPFLTAANLFVTNAMGSDHGLDATTLEEIERWVCAHLVCARDPRVTEEEYGDARVKYGGKTDMGFQSTHYGQTALALDPTGRIAAAGSSKKVTAEVKAIL